MGIMGFLAIWNVKMSVNMAAILVIALGFSVDFSAHIAEGYNAMLHKPTSEPGDPAEMMSEVLSTLGISVLHGAKSTMLATCVLAFASTVVFRDTFKTFLLL